MKNLSLIREYFKKSFHLLVFGFLALTLCDLAQMFIPRLVGKAIDLLAEDTPQKKLLIDNVTTILILSVIVASLRYLWRHLIYGFARKLDFGLREKLYYRLIALSPTWHHENSSGDLMALATNDIESVRMAVGFGLVSLTDALVLGLAAIVFMLSISPYLSIFAFLPMPLVSILTSRFGHRIYQRVLETQDLFGRLTEVIREQISGFKVIRAMALEPLAKAEVNRSGLTYMNKNIRLALVSGAFFPFLSLLTNMALALTLYIGGKETIYGDMSTGDFVAFISYLVLLTWPMMALGLTLGLLQQGLASLDRLARVILAEEKSPHPVTIDYLLPEGPLDIVIDNLSYTYPGRQSPALSSVSLNFPATGFYGIAGPTGSGKSTLAALLPALYEPHEGKIILGGHSSISWPLERLRALFGYVPQDGYIFTGSLGENIAFGKPSADKEEIIKAAEMAGFPIDPDVFPHGLDTRVGEKGITLSGGQKQRLALARALLIDPLILIMDDTLSAVDAAVEADILNRIGPLRKGKSTIIISHRVTSLVRADKIFILEEGRLTAEGSYEELTSRDGYFKRITELAKTGADNYSRSRSFAAERKTDHV